MIYPWQQTQWENLLQRHQQHTLPHALLFLGLEGIGKKQLARAFAKQLFCIQGKSCDQCDSCHWCDVETHPDLKWITPEKEEGMIKIDQIRDVIDFVNQTGLQSRYRIVIIDPASSMNISSANALLKTLEEPAPDTLFILIASQLGKLPATILSRCQKIVFHKPEKKIALAWLQNQVKDTSIDVSLLLNMAHGAPLKALTWLKKDSISLRHDFYQAFILLTEKKIDPIALAAEWYEKDVMMILYFLLLFLYDCLRSQFREESILNQDYASFFRKIKISPAHLFDYIDQVNHRYSPLLSSVPLNRQLVLEDLFIQWGHILRQTSDENQN